MTMRVLAALSLLLLLVTGCEMGPGYVRPRVDMPFDWRFKDSGASVAANTLWWEQFHDTALCALIAEALARNIDVRIAFAREDEFLGAYWMTRASLLPEAGYSGSAARTRISPNAQLAPSQNPFNDFALGANASWQIDIWGKLRRASEAARADLLATGAARRAVTLTVIGSVAGAYVNLLDLDLQLDIAKRTAQSREDSYNLFKLQFDRGVISELELYQAESQWQQALSTIAPLKRDVARQENALSIILGRNPGPIDRIASIDSLILPAVPAGLPCSLLVHRPDIASAEEQLIAANARIGVARAYFLPAINLTGVFGWASTQLSNLLTGPSQAWNYSANISGLIFSGGAAAGLRKTAEAQKEQALLRYRQSILSALADVENALIDQKQAKSQLQTLQKQVEALRNVDRYAKLRYENGYTSYIEVLDAERSLFAAEVSLAQVKGQMFSAFIDLYTAMGGGWEIGR